MKLKGYMGDKLQIGIVGAGSNTRNRHIPGFQSIDGVEVVVLANRTRESSQRVADSFGIRRIAEKWEDVVSDPGVDAVCIGTWPNLHAAATIAALENGKHVLTEARMARNLEEAEQMLAASRAHPDLVAQIVPAPMSSRTMVCSPRSRFRWIAAWSGGEIGKRLAKGICLRSTFTTSGNLAPVARLRRR